MPRRGAGQRYPHATTSAREHDHRFCPVVGKLAMRVKDGVEEWGTPHPLPAIPGELQADDARRGLFRGRSCKQLAKTHGPLSVSVTYLTPDGQLSNAPVRRDEGYVLVVRVWSRGISKKEIARRVHDGEQLHYNVLRI